MQSETEKCFKLIRIAHDFRFFRSRSHLRLLSCPSKLLTGFHCSEGRSSTSRLLWSHQSPECSYRNKQAAWNSSLALLQQKIKQITIYGKYFLHREAIAKQNLKWWQWPVCFFLLAGKSWQETWEENNKLKWETLNNTGEL